jgi:hypothetical protein
MNKKKQRKEDDATLDLPTLGMSAYRAYCAARQIATTPDWEKLSAEEQEGFLCVAKVAREMAEQHYTDTAAAMAEKLRTAFTHANGVGLLPSAAEWTAWEAVARHLAYLASDADVNEGLGELEQSWREWAKQKLAQTSQI